jgi:hypothetical protein
MVRSVTTSRSVPSREISIRAPSTRWRGLTVSAVAVPAIAALFGAAIGAAATYYGAELQVRSADRSAIRDTHHTAYANFLTDANQELDTLDALVPVSKQLLPADYDTAARQYNQTRNDASSVELLGDRSVAVLAYDLVYQLNQYVKAVETGSSAVTPRERVVDARTTFLNAARRDLGP